MSLTVIHLPADDPGREGRLAEALRAGLEALPHTRLTWDGEIPLSALGGKRLLFALSLGEDGMNTAALRLISRLRRAGGEVLSGCVAGLVVDGPGALYTKSSAVQLSLALNQAGCALVGRPLVEATGDLGNFRIQAKNLQCTLEEAYRAALGELGGRISREIFPRQPKPGLLVLHASSHHTSNTMALWGRVRAHLGDSVAVREIGLRNGTLSDCSGCPYTMCLHFGERGGCFYGGVMQEEVYPAVRECRGIVMLCPNYNDALSANLTAFINRLTALFRQTRFYDKALFSVVVSGYSGGDILSGQLIASMNMNKSFYLPGRFALTETANDPGEVLSLPGIEERAEAFARRIRDTLCLP